MRQLDSAVIGPEELQFAASKALPNVFEYLLLLPAANVDLKPAFLCACEPGDEVIVSSLLYRNRINPPMHNYEALKRAAASGNLNVVKLLVEYITSHHITDQDDRVIELSQIPPRNAQVFNCAPKNKGFP